MLTNHQVVFDPCFVLSGDENEKNRKEIMLFGQSLISASLKKLGIDFDKLDEQRKSVLFRGLGTISGNVPMLCFSEIPENVSISDHANRFGCYGLVMSKEWIEKSQGDRVVYVGKGASLSKRIMQSVTAILAQSIYVDENGTPLFANWAMKNVLELLTFFEVKINENEREWRIVGRTGFMGEKRDTEQRINFDMSECKYIFVKKDDEMESMAKIVKNVMGNSNSAPQIMRFPDKMPE